MAVTALDFIVEIGILEILIPFLIGFAVIYGLLTKTKVIGDNNTLNVIAGLMSGFVIVLSWSGRTIIYNSLMVFMLLLFFAFVVLLLKTWLNLDIKIIFDFVKQPYVLVPGILFLIVGYSLISSGVLDPLMERIQNQTGMDMPTTEVESAADLTNPMTVLSQPQVIGSVLILSVFAAITYMITRRK